MYKFELTSEQVKMVSTAIAIQSTLFLGKEAAPTTVELLIAAMRMRAENPELFEGMCKAFVEPMQDINAKIDALHDLGIE